MAKNTRNPESNLNALPVNMRQSVRGFTGQKFTAYKTVIETINTSAVIQNDDELYVSLPTGFWFLEMNLNIAIANAAHNIRYSFSAPDGLVLVAGGTSLMRGFLGINGVAAQEDPITNVGITVTGGTTSAWTSLRIAGGIQVIQAGTLQFQWAQNVSGASNTSVQGGSTMIATQVTN
jgi:hypothetical protein